jgi:hypothetical protein
MAILYVKDCADKRRFFSIWAIFDFSASSSINNQVKSAESGKSLIKFAALPLSFFITALLVRLVGLSGHPFVMTGAEANVGLDALRILRGEIGNPFAGGGAGRLSAGIHGSGLDGAAAVAAA